MIIYFTGTGNSRFAAQRIAEATGCLTALSISARERAPTLQKPLSACLSRLYMFRLLRLFLPISSAARGFPVAAPRISL